MEIYKEIRRMRLEGISHREIASHLHISRNTVKKYWDGENVPPGAEEISEKYLRSCSKKDAM